MKSAATTGRRGQPTDPCATRPRALEGKGAARVRVALFLCLLLPLGAPVPALAVAVTEAFEAGVTASRAGNHREAVERFEAARRAGLDTPALHFNLGVALYHLGEMERARASFLRAYREPEMAAPAAYNLGRIAREQGDIAAARRWFGRAVERARTEAVRARARRALAALGRGPAADAFALVSLGAGHDSNVQLAPDESAALSRESDLFASTQVYARRRLDGGAYLFASGYTEQYLDVHNADLVSVAGGAGWRGSGDARPDARVVARHVRFGGDGFEHAVLARTGTERRLVPGSVRLGIEADRYAGASGFDYLDGNAVRARATWRRPDGEALWTVDATAERVDRRDADASDEFFSFSYNAASLELGHTRPLAGDAHLRLSADWKGYRYDDPEIRGGTERERRREHHFGLRAFYEMPLEGAWWWRAGLEGDYRESNIGTYDYSRLRATFAVERSF